MFSSTDTAVNDRKATPLFFRNGDYWLERFEMLVLSEGSVSFRKDIPCPEGLQSNSPSDLQVSTL